MSETVVLQQYETQDAVVEGTSTTLKQSNSTQMFKRKKANMDDEVVTKSTQLMFGSEKNPDSFPDGGSQANIVLLGSFIGLIADFGIANSMGAIESYVSANQLKSLKQTDVSWVFSLHLGVMYFGGVFFGELFDKFGARKPMVVSTICITVGLILTAESKTLLHFILSFSILTAIGTSIAMAPLVGSLSHWFLKKRGMACSIATIGGLIGGTVFPIMLQNLYGKVGFAWGIRILALICMFCMSISVFLVRERKVEKVIDVQLSIINEDDILSPQETIDDDQKLINKNPFKSFLKFLRECLDLSLVKDPRFVLLTLAVAGAELISMTTLTFITSYALSVGISNYNAYLLATIINVTGIPSRLLSGYLADSYGRFNVMIVTSILTTGVIFGLWLPAKNHISILFAFGALFGISTSAVISLIGACTGQICSVESFGKVYGTLYFFLSFLTILGMYFASLVINKGSELDYRNFILYEGALGITSICLWIAARYTAVGWKWCKF